MDLSCVILLADWIFKIVIVTMDKKERFRPFVRHLSLQHKYDNLYMIVFSFIRIGFSILWSVFSFTAWKIYIMLTLWKAILPQRNFFHFVCVHYVEVHATIGLKFRTDKQNINIITYYFRILFSWLILILKKINIKKYFLIW